MRITHHSTVLWEASVYCCNILSIEGVLGNFVMLTPLVAFFQGQRDEATSNFFNSMISWHRHIHRGANLNQKQAFNRRFFDLNILANLALAWPLCLSQNTANTRIGPNEYREHNVREI
ncbi:uncharacterized protein BDR25DRAFT_358395 [Lindgomyces ingoldianus]|uniref:Uncharacterized protein n=1 Tax=Lindgomyces ingoldianus TaxID=673940 RepID=A0ACB6QL75_9PLEO|nr:uncharacterized protein BDR25DRAFT_358395 [Lindgomyces ingoldianus]KAF2467709.1 hypothetical protein BDR25DRAFT_358395 [Lindgomyces ingoldianus]